MTHQQSKLKPFLTFFLLLLFDKVSINPRPGILIVGPKTRDTYDTWDTRPETWNPYDK